MIQKKNELKIFSSFQKNLLKEVDFSPQTRCSSKLGPGVKGHPPGVTRVVSENTVPSSASSLGLNHSVPVKTEEDGGGGGVRLSVHRRLSLSLSDLAPEQSWTKDQDVKCRSSRQSGEFMRLARLSVTLVRKDVEDEEL